VPKFLENDTFGQWYDRIEPGMAGAEALKSIIIEYFGHLLKRYILGQTLTTESAGTGLGSNLADVHLATFLQIVKYDATNLEETLTTDLLEPMIRFNFPWAVGLPFRFRIDTESENSEAKLQAYKLAHEMGLKIPAQAVYDLIGCAKPAPGDEVLDREIAAESDEHSAVGD
jgi:phage gp29-like protein